MYRSAIEQLLKWKEKKDKKPLIIRGARQVGKTWLMKEFGRQAYDSVIYISFDNNKRMQDLFEADLDVERIISGLELYAGQKIIPYNTLLIFDEVQEVPKALTSLKYFNENAPQYQIVCAGSQLGIALHRGTSFPVGKVEFLDLFPLTFTEFMTAMGKKRFVDVLKQDDYEMVSFSKQTFIEMLRNYYFIGGMPEAVLSFKENKDFDKVREIQHRILEAYEQDFSKHAPYEAVPKIRMLWNNIPAQLAKENKKFFYGMIKEGARAKDFELAMLWLSDCGHVHKIHRVTSPNLPLTAYVDLKSFKLFFVDVGLLSCMVRLNKDSLLDGNELFKEFKGALTEQYVLQQLITLKNIKTYYWTNDQGTAEVDFIIDNGSVVIPVEVKAEANLQAKSLKVYRDKYKPVLTVRTSMMDHKKEEWLLNLPLYAVEMIGNAVSL